MQNISELARIVMPASDFLDYQELFINREEGTCRLDGILKQVNIYKFNTWMNMFAAQKHYFYCDLGNIYLHLDIQGKYRLQVTGSNRNFAFERLDDLLLDTDCENNVCLKIDNAEKYSDYGSDITINVSDDVLSISNQCSSFDRENLSKLWQPYFRAAKGDNKSGSGIGLSIVKSALEMHGFKYKAEFENGIITFKFRFTSLD